MKAILFCLLVGVGFTYVPEVMGYAAMCALGMGMREAWKGLWE